MNIPANITMIDGATSAAISNVFVNNNCAAVTLQITGSFTTATVQVEGLVNLNSNSWVSLGAIELGEFEPDSDGLSEKSLYQVGIEGIPRVRIHVTAVSGGDITVVCQFGAAVIDPSADVTPANLTPITAYDMAVAGGYTGTKAQFETDMGNSGTNATNAAASASAAAASATTASNAAANFASAYSSSATYAVGDHVLYNGGYYVCNTAITTAEAWTAAHWTAVKVGPEITDLKTQIKDVNEMLETSVGNQAIITKTGFAINKNGSAVSMSGGVPVMAEASSYCCAYVPCEEGDVFFVSGQGGILARTFMIIDSSGTIKTTAGEDSNLTNYKVTCPADSAFFIVNNRLSDGRFSFKGIPYNEVVQGEIDKNKLFEDTLSFMQNNCKFPYDINVFGVGEVSSGAYYPNQRPYRCCTKIPLSFPVDITVKAYNNYRFYVYLYENSAWAGKGWKTDYTFPANSLFEIIFAKTTEDTSSTADVEKFLKEFTVSIPGNIRTTENNLKIANLLRFGNFSFDFFSDVHSSAKNANNVVTHAIRNAVNVVINGGDTVNQFLSDPNDSFTWYADMINSSTVDILSAVGNHDVWKGATFTPAPATDVYNAIIAPIIAKFTGIVQPQDAATNGLCYYYKDYSTVRVIIINAMDGDSTVRAWDAAQATWFESVLNDAKTNNKHVIVCNHPAYPKNIAIRHTKSNWTSWMDYTDPNADAIVSALGPIELVQDFIDAGGKFICWLTGHEHVDNLLTATGYEEQLMVNIASAKYVNHPDGIAYSDENSPYYDCFNFGAVDTTHGILKIMRIGWDRDSSMKVRDTLGYNYFTHEVIHE